MLDSKLFKALRAGGLGHKAAALLAERSSRYSLEPYNVDDGPYSALTVNLGLGGMTCYASPDAVIIDFSNDRQAFPAVPFPLAANTAVAISHSVFTHDEGDTYPDLFRLRLSFTKMADANGIPVAPAFTNLDASRSGGVVTRPSSTGVYTVVAHVNPALGFQVNVTAAGFYAVTASAIRS